MTMLDGSAVTGGRRTATQSLNEAESPKRFWRLSTRPTDNRTRDLSPPGPLCGEGVSTSPGGQCRSEFSLQQRKGHLEHIRRR